MLRHLVIIGTFSAVLLGAGASASGFQDYETVVVTGEGVSEDAARHDALRKAVETAGRNEISSHSQVRDFELIRDTIYARAEGFVEKYDILEEGPAVGGIRICKIRATVRRDGIASTWGEVQNMLDQLGQPGIAVMIDERIDGIVQDSSILETQIEKRLLEMGFRVFAGAQLRAIAEKEKADAAAVGDIARVQAIAKDFGTQIFITGSAQANAAGVKDLYGEPTAMYNGDAAIKMYFTDTAELCASESLANWRGGARGYKERSPQAGKKALENAGVDLVEQCYQSVMKNWSTRVTAGGTIILEIAGASVLDALKLKKALLEIDPDRIVSVNQSVTHGVATFRILAKMNAEALAERLMTDDWTARIELVDLKTNRIQAKKVGP